MAVIGPNGAGKIDPVSNLLTGHLRPDTGSVQVDGRDITGAAPHKICGMGIGRSFQRTNIFSRLTVFENVQAAYLVHHRRGLNFWSRANDFYRDETAALLASIGLEGQESAVAGTLSYGNQKQLELGLRCWRAPIRRCCCSTSRPPACRRARLHETIRLIEKTRRRDGH